MKCLAIFLATTWLAAQAALAGDGCIAPTGCEQEQCHHDPGCCPKCGTKMVCKTVCEIKEIKKTVWNVKCEPFCAPLPRCGRCCGCGDPACGGCEAGCGTIPACCDGTCDQCKNCDPCAVENAKCYVPPKCGPVRTKKTLEKKEVTCKVPSYKCVPVCCHCGGGCGDPGGCGAGCSSPAPVKETSSAGQAIEPASAAFPGKTTRTAPLPPMLGTAYAK